MAWPAGSRGVCHGAHAREGPVLASLAMLAPALAPRVAPGGSAPLFPFVARHGLDASGRDGKAGGQPNRKAWVASPPEAWPNATRNSQLIVNPEGTF